MTYLNIRDFGAVGDGVHDDTPALAAAMNQAVREEGTVYFPSGIYGIHPVSVPSHITLCGCSAWSEGKEMGTAVLKALSGDARALLDLDAARGTRILGLTLDGGYLGREMHGIYSKHGGVEQNNCYEDLKVCHFTGCGLKFDWVWVFAVRRCLITENRLHGMDVDRGYDGWVIDSTFSHNEDSGIIAGPGMVCYTGNRIDENGLYGMVLDDTQNVNVTGNRFFGNKGPAVFCRKSRSSAFSGNVISSCGLHGPQGQSCQVYLENSCGITFTGNALSSQTEGAPECGIVCKDMTDSILLGNTLSHAAGRELVSVLGENVRTICVSNCGSLPETAEN